MLGLQAAVLVGQQEKSKATAQGMLPAHLRFTLLIPGLLLLHVASSSVHTEVHFPSQTVPILAFPVLPFTQTQLLHEVPTWVLFSWHFVRTTKIKMMTTTVLTTVRRIHTS